ncbi:unnamed protein product [Nezara viridula]|uniref:Uncharacterized protein n=1 Tax=Nezara viridula TaxID=85310 RepID=A0A9P0H575_NEZVI|nr:unnamed protein product [Nezara viridula]
MHNIPTDRRMSGGIFALGFVESKSSLLEKVQSMTSVIPVTRVRKRKRKIKNIFNVMLNVVETLLELCIQSKTMMSLKLYKYRRPSMFYRHEKSLKYKIRENEEEEKHPPEEWLLEKETIRSLKRMMSDQKIQKNTQSEYEEDLKTETLAKPGNKIIQSYLDRFKDEDREELNIRNKLRMKEIYQLDADNLFTTSEMGIIKWRKVLFHREMRKSRKLKKKEENLKSEPKSEVWEFKEFLNHSFDKPNDDPSSTISQPVALSKEQVVQMLNRHLKSWLNREYPLREGAALKHRFHYYEPKYKYHKRNIGTDEDRLKVSIRFARLAQIAYPDLDVNEILSGLTTYFGNIEIPNISKRETPEREHTKVTEKMELLEGMGIPPKKLKKIMADKRFEEGQRKETTKTFVLKKIKELMKLYDLESLYDEFRKADFPTPYDSLYVEMVKGMFKIHHSITVYGKLDQALIMAFIRNMSQLIFDSVQWLIDSLLKSPILLEIKEREEEHEMPMKQRKPHNKFIKQEKVAHDKLKKAMMKVIKYQMLHVVVSGMMNDDLVDLSSSEPEPLENKTSAMSIGK